MEYQFIEGYAIAVYEEDISKISAHYHAFFTLSTPTNLWQIKNDEMFRTNLKKSFEGYKELGATHCKLLRSNITELAPNDMMIDVVWGLLDKQQNLLIQFDITYFAKQIEGDWKFIFVIDHNENERISAYKRGRPG